MSGKSAELILAEMNYTEMRQRQKERATTAVDRYLKAHSILCDEARNLSSRKNHDYAAPGRSVDDPYAVFKNFRQVELLGICSTEQGFLTRLSDKFTRLANLLADGHVAAVKDENIDDTIRDIINYCCLLHHYRQVKAFQTPPMPATNG